MTFLPKQAHQRRGTRRRNDGGRSLGNQFKFRSKTLLALLAIAVFVYFFSVLIVAVQVHKLHLTESEEPARTRKFRSRVDEENKNGHTSTGGNEHVERRNTNDQRSGDKPGHEVQVVVAASKETRRSNDKNLKPLISKDKVKDQETKPQPNTRKDVVRDQEMRPKPPTRKRTVRRPGFKANPHGHMVSPEIIFERRGNTTEQNPNLLRRNIPEDQILAAYIEPIDRSTWDSKPLPIRKVKAKDLVKTEFPKLNSCSKLPEQWPVDDYPEADPFLPWIHDVFPVEDGKFIQFVAQNKRRCHTGSTPEDEYALDHTAPQIALFQHVPLARLENSTNESPRYRLSSHEDANPESISTRFICRFKPSGDITFSEFNNDYEWASAQKGQLEMFHEDGRDNAQIHTSQLIFRCPVPDHLRELVRTGESVVDDWATIFIDLIPIRTPPRYGDPSQFLVPHYASSRPMPKDRRFDPQKEWGKDHVLPELKDSGRWENIPVCKPSLMAYEPQALQGAKRNDKKKHHLVSCLWASTGYTTRGNRFAVNDGQRRIVEWITFNKILGFDHFYIYDNSGAYTNLSSFQPIADIFPGDITLIKWPSRVCNNNPNNVDSVGERSSQYAAETSCRLRFGSHVNWIGQFDIDEYLIPMGNFSSLLPLLEKLDDEGKKIINFASLRAWPRRTHINNPEETSFKYDEKLCGRRDECFELSVQENTTMLEAYNCDRQKPGKKSSTMPAEKQIYRADYVKQHFIHYSTITETTNLDRNEFIKKFGKKRPFPDPLMRFGDEENEGLMLHSKAIARQDTAGWKSNCHEGRKSFDLCRIGFPWPEDGSDNAKSDDNGWSYNCYVNLRIENFWAPKVKSKLVEMGFMKSNK